MLQLVIMKEVLHKHTTPRKTIFTRFGLRTMQESITIEILGSRAFQSCVALFVTCKGIPYLYTQGLLVLDMGPIGEQITHHRCPHLKV